MMRLRFSVLGMGKKIVSMKRRVVVKAPSAMYRTGKIITRLETVRKM